MTEEDLPTVETPTTLNVSPLGSFATEPQSENDPAKPEEPKAAAAPSPSMPITKVQPFMHGEALTCSVLIVQHETMHTGRVTAGSA